MNRHMVNRFGFRDAPFMRNRSAPADITELVFSCRSVVVMTNLSCPVSGEQVSGSFSVLFYF